MKNTLIFNNPDVAIKLTKEEAILLNIDTNQEQVHGELKTAGCWNIPVSFRAICISGKYEKSFFTKCIEKTIYGIRTLTNLTQGGHELEGRVSINGKKYTAFTSSQLFEIDGKLIDVAVIHARVN